MTTLNRILPTAIALVIGAAGVALLLFAWQLPPFHPAHPTTRNAYVRGTVVPVAPQLAGYVSTVEAQDFQPVTRGQVIARIDDRIFRQKLAQAEAQLEAAHAARALGDQNVAAAEAGMRAAEAGLASARAASQNARSEWDRANRLQDRGVASQASADGARQALDQAAAAVAQAQAQLDVQHEAAASARVALSSREADIAAAEAQVELARIDLENTVIRAQADGRLGALSVHEGQYVTPGTALVAEVGADLWVVANFRETELAGIAPGDAVRLTVDAVPGREFTGRVTSFSPATASEFSLLAPSNATGNFTKVAQRLPVRIEIDPGQPDADRLAPGLSVVVEVRGG